MLSVGSRAVGAVLGDLVTFFRPSHSDVREEQQRLEMSREEPPRDSQGLA
jgi:hypothetical protein